MKIEKINRTIEGNFVTISAKISDLPDGKYDTLWYKFPKELNQFIPDRHDPLFVAMLGVSLKEDKPMIIEGEMSERLLMSGAYQFANIWKTHFKEISSQLKIQATKKPSRKNFRGSATAMFFTGGVDSFYTLLKNLDNEKGDGRISHLIYAHSGFDTISDNTDVLVNISKHLQEIANAFNLKLIFVTTNLKIITDRYIDWDWSHGACIASVGLWLSPLFKYIYFASDMTYSGCNRIRIWGNHNLITPLWSTESTQFIDDGSEATRPQKIQWRIAKSDIALKHLRVCYRNTDNRYNCCQCEKCLRTMTTLHIAGILQHCKTFDKALDYERISNVSLILSKAIFIEDNDMYWKENLDFLEQQGNYDPKLKLILTEVLEKHTKLLQ
ncbi:MAG: hypothetical protein QM487_00220 [Candidatus Marithrix sp.]